MLHSRHRVCVTFIYLSFFYETEYSQFSDNLWVVIDAFLIVILDRSGYIVN